MKKKMSNFGFSTLLIGFTMLCIIIFSALALITANSDYKLSQKYAQKNITYYKAEKDAYATISEIDSELYKLYHTNDSKSDYFEAVANFLTGYPVGNIEVISDEQIEFNFSIKLSDFQTLNIALEINYPVSSDDSFYHINNWQIQTDTSIDEDDTLNLIGKD